MPRAAIVAGIALAAVAVAAWLFPRAVPTVALQQSLTRDVALARADSFFSAHSLAPAGARTAVRFQGDASLRTFVELAGGGLDSLNALVRGDDVAPFTWSVRAFVPGDPREARVEFAPDGRIIGFERELAEADERPAVSPDSGRRLAERVLDALGRRARRALEAGRVVLRNEEDQRAHRPELHLRAYRPAHRRRAHPRRGGHRRRHAGAASPLRRDPRVIPAALRRDAIVERPSGALRQCGHRGHDRGRNLRAPRIRP